MPMTALKKRSVLEVSGEDRLKFLQAIITADVNRLKTGEGLYSCMLSPQGKILFDFFLYAKGEAILLEVLDTQSEALLRKLRLYKLRAKVEIIERNDLHVWVGWGESQSPESAVAAMPDPRLSELGWRALATVVETEVMLENCPPTAYDEFRVSKGVPDSVDYIQEKAYPAEYGLEALHGLSSTKGCYVGQEVVARMRSRGNVKRTLCIVTSKAELPEPGTVLLQSAKEVGQLRTVCGKKALAVIKCEALTDGNPMTAHSTEVNASLPEWFAEFLEVHNSRQAP